jgi:hypothetical protein
MVATNACPENARLVFSINLLKNKRAFWILQITGTLLFFMFGGFFVWYTIQIRSALFQYGLLEGLGAAMGNASLILFVLEMIGCTAIVLLAHELVHGAFFWIYSRSRPVFGLRSGYAYAAAPGWFFPPRQYLVIALAPLILLSILGLAIVAILPAGALALTLFGMVVNAAGAVGDIYIAFKVVRERRPIVIEDLGDGMNFYALP